MEEIKAKLAIVIPAFKGNFLEDTLNSIVEQTCKNFTLYIGDDNSPDNLHSLIKNYQDKINIIYKHFDENLGGKDLVAHWERCIDLTRDEEWLWLFSDDDIMGEKCVEYFYAYIEKNKELNLVHFNLNIIDRRGNILKKCIPFPVFLTVSDFFSLRIKNIINSTVVDFIFRKSKYYEVGKFNNYDLGWCSDDATWIKIGMSTGITTISDVLVNWRDSGLNISSNIEDRHLILRKLNSYISYIKWIKGFLICDNFKDRTSQSDKFKWIIYVLFSSSSFTFKEKQAYRKLVIKELEFDRIKIFSVAYCLYLEIKSLSKIDFIKLIRYK